MSTLKSHLKAARDAISLKEWARAEAAAEAALAMDSHSYNAHVFLGLAALNLEKTAQSLEAYRAAITLDPTQPLAWQGLVRLYETNADSDGLIDTLESLANIWNEKHDAEKLGDTVLKLINLPGKSRKQTISALSHLLPDSPYEGLLLTLQEPDCTNPNGSSLFELQMMLRNTLPTLQKLTDLIKSEEMESISREISKRRTRLTSVPKTATQTRMEVIREFYPSSQLPKLWKQTLNHSCADDETRREVEIALLTFYLDWLEALSSQCDDDVTNSSNNTVVYGLAKSFPEVICNKQDGKSVLRNEILELARGQVILNIANWKCWDIVLDWNEIISPSQDDDAHGYLNSIPDVFPRSDVTTVLQAYSEFHSKSKSHEMSDIDEILDHMETAFESAQKHSLISHFLVLSVYQGLRDWSAVKTIAETCISKMKELERLIGKRLAKAMRKLEESLAIAFTHLDFPRHHLRATRLIDQILADEPENGPILMVQAHIMKAAQRWSEAISSFTCALNVWTDQPHRHRLEARSDKAWCLVELGRVEEALEKFDGIIQELRDLVEADPEDETLHQNLAHNLYRLGRCNWALYHSDDRREVLDLTATQIAKLKGETYSSFIKSIKAYTAFAPSFTYLGLYYSEEGDHARASKCFQKAFELDATESLAAFRLATEFADLREWDLVEVVAKRLISGGSSSGVDDNIVTQSPKILELAGYQQHSWAWNAIGSAELSHGKFDLAIGTFQRAIRTSPSDPHTWIKLGLAYRGTGKYVAALKSFVRARQLFDNENGDCQSNSWFADFCVCDLQRRIGLIEPAMTGFKKIVEERPQELAVKIILAETRYANAVQYSKNGEFAKSEVELISSLDLVREVFEAGDAMYTLRGGWKIASDVFSEFAQWNKTIPTSTFNADRGEDDPNEKLKTHMSFYVDLAAKIGVDSKLFNTDSVTCLEVSAIGAENGSSGMFLLTSIIASKVRVVLELSEPGSPGCAQAWADLGVTLGQLSRWLEATSRSSPFTDQSTFFKTQAGPEVTLRQAIRCVRSALKIESSNSQFWNTLGTLSFHLGPRLCQHAYIKSVELNPKNYVSWTNLGFFYLAHSDVELANQAFLNAQTYEPSGALAWLGQALVAALNDHMNDSVDLVEQAFTLSQSNVTQIDLAYTTIALSRSGETAVQHADDLLAPLLAVNKLLQRFPVDPTILNLHGMLSEASGKYEEAHSSLEKAAEILEAVYEETESVEVENRFMIVNLNLGRIRLITGEYAESHQAFEVVRSLRGEFDRQNDKIEDAAKIMTIRAQAASGIALGHFLLGDSEASVQEFKAILGELSAIDGSQSETLTRALRQHISALAQLLSRILWTVEGEERKSEARDILFGVASRNSRSMYCDLEVVISLAAMSILDQNDDLLQNVLESIQNNNDSRLGEAADQHVNSKTEHAASYNSHFGGTDSLTSRLAELVDVPTSLSLKREANTILQLHEKVCVSNGIGNDPSSLLQKTSEVLLGSVESIRETDAELNEYAQLERIKKSNLAYKQLTEIQQMSRLQGLCLPNQLSLQT